MTMAPTPTTPPSRKIGIRHIQLVYETVGERLQCRMCLLRKREVDEGTRVATYPLSAAYVELVGHCEREYDAALDALICMTPGDIVEMHQRMRVQASPSVRGRGRGGRDVHNIDVDVDADDDDDDRRTWHDVTTKRQHDTDDVTHENGVN
ncbi:hypothetical protein B0F90DRAFT_1671335 [Multifurca ochricompacta]|uniref:Uncharacterized protein n=1 Tax=Multifurca ochricompacta TaxID=376703 RepID=A0AAD4LVE3_9AGAM|nr:hypothetical protein B0F90DRAFT_1671335 [Multifurca ochricompacta]